MALKLSAFSVKSVHTHTHTLSYDENVMKQCEIIDYLKLFKYPFTRIHVHTHSHRIISMMIKDVRGFLISFRGFVWGWGVALQKFNRKTLKFSWEKKDLMEFSEIIWKILHIS